MGHQNPYLPPGCTDADVDRAMGADEPRPQCGCEGPCDCDGPNPPATAADTTWQVEGLVPPGGSVVAPGSSPKRSLRDNPAFEDIDGRIRALDTMRGLLTNADRAPWSVLSDLHREAEALVSAIRRARRQL